MYTLVCEKCGPEKAVALAASLVTLFDKTPFEVNLLSVETQRSWRKKAVSFAECGLPNKAFLYAVGTGPSDEELLSIAALLDLIDLDGGRL